MGNSTGAEKIKASRLPYGRTGGTTEGTFTYETTINQNTETRYGKGRGVYGNRCYGVY